MEKSELTRDDILRLYTLVDNYRLLYDGEYIYLGDGEGGCNPNIEQREKVVPRIKQLYDEYKIYMTDENMTDGFHFEDMQSKKAYGLRCLKKIWEDEAKYYYENLIENTSAQQEYSKQQTTNKSKGRPSKPFDDILVKDKEATKRILHSLIDGKQNSKAVIYIKVAIQLGIIQKPTHTQFINEFGPIVSKQIFNKYLSGNKYSDDELIGAKQALSSE